MNAFDQQLAIRVQKRLHWIIRENSRWVGFEWKKDFSGKFKYLNLILKKMKEFKVYYALRP